MTTPIERAAEAIAGEYDRRNKFKPGTWWSAEHRRDLLRTEARAVFESIDRDELAAFLDSPTHAPMDTHSGRDGSCLECPWPVHELPPADLADAIIAYLLGEQP